MNCQEVIPLLSPFHDGELSLKERRVVTEHIASCAACAEKLRSMRRLSDLVELTPTPAPPGRLLKRLEQSLESPVSVRQWFKLGSPQSRVAAMLLAAAGVIAICLTVWKYNSVPSHNHEEMVRAFNEFIDSYEQGRKSAEELLARRYSGTLVDVVAATTALKRPTVSRPVILANHHATKRYLLKMPCCDCVQTIYTRDGKTSFVLFEHEKQQSEWFDGRPMIRADCRDKSCCMVQLKDSLAATWPVDGGFVTIMGVRDVEGLGDLIDELRSL